MCWTFLGTQSMISSQRLGQNLLDLRGKMRLTMLTVFDERRPKPQPELFNLEQISQVGRKWITVQRPPASSRGCVYHSGCVVGCVPLCTKVYLCVPLWLYSGCVYHCGLLCVVVYYLCGGCGLCTTIAILCRYSMTPTDRQPPFANFFTTPNNLQSLEILWTQGPPHNRWLATLCNFFCLYRQYLHFYFEFRALCRIHGFVSYK